MVEIPLALGPLVSSADLREMGVSAVATHRLVKAQTLWPLTRGWFATRCPESAEQRHRLLTLAALETLGPGCVPSHYTALLHRALPLFRADLSTVHLARVGTGWPKGRPGLVVHRPIAAEAVTGDRIHLGLAIAQTGITCGAMAALIAADAALHRGLASSADLDRGLTWVRRHPHSGQLASFLGLADGASESPGETRLRYVLHLMKCSVAPQSWIRDGDFAARVDFELVNAKVILEFDGLVKYGGSADTGTDSGRRALIAEKRREDRLRELGYEVVRVTWDELADPMTLSRKINAAILRAQARHGVGVRRGVPA